MARPAVVLHVDTGTDDAAAIAWAATSGAVDLVAVLTGWGNVDADVATRNTRAVLAHLGRSDVPVHAGLGVASAGPGPRHYSAELVMGADGLNGVQLARADAVAADRPASDAGAIEALVRLVDERPGELTLVEVAPCTTLAAALDARPDLPSLLAGFTFMGGSIGEGGNLSPASEANVGNDPGAAAKVVEAFGRPGALAGGAVARLVPLDVCHRCTVDEHLLEAARASSSSSPSADLLARIWQASMGIAHLEGPDAGLPVYDLLAVWSVVHPDALRWERVPLAVDDAGGPAWGMTVADRRVATVEGSGLDADEQRRVLEVMGAAPDRWDVALGVDVDAWRRSMVDWLSGTVHGPGSEAAARLT